MCEGEQKSKKRTENVSLLAAISLKQCCSFNTVALDTAIVCLTGLLATGVRHIQLNETA